MISPIELRLQRKCVSLAVRQLAKSFTDFAICKIDVSSARLCSHQSSVGLRSFSLLSLAYLHVCSEVKEAHSDERILL